MTFSKGVSENIFTNAVAVGVFGLGRHGNVKTGLEWPRFGRAPCFLAGVGKGRGGSGSPIFQASAILD